MTERYFTEGIIDADRVTLEGAEAHHLLHVMRAEPGAQVVLFDGQGGEYDATVAVCGRASVELEVTAERAIERELPYCLTLAVPLPKGDRQRWLVEKAVELGVARLIPLRTDCSSVGRGDHTAKLSRYVIEAAKQCGRNRLMEIAKPVAWQQFVQQSEPLPKQRLMAHPGGRPLDQIDLQPTASALAVGPEGGFTDEEVDLATSAGWKSVDLGGRILRVETAALALASAVIYSKSS